jgi:ABC-type multidrug transport system fused ATPase/permease subunit
LLSKAAQRLITELRQQVQAHISRLPVAFYDTNKTGTLVSRIMSDVEGVRNLLGTGLVDFAGGLVTSAIALVLLLRTSVQMTLIAVGSLLCFRFALNKAFGTIRPIFRERRQDQCRSYRAAHRIPGRRSSDQGLSRRRARGGGFAGGVKACSIT